MYESYFTSFLKFTGNNDTKNKLKFKSNSLGWISKATANVSKSRQKFNNNNAT